MPGPPAHTGFLFPRREYLRHDIYPAISAAQSPALKQPGKVVLITGAGRGIGRATALQYAHADVASIVLCARTTPQLDEVQNEITMINNQVRVHKFSLDVIDDTVVAHCAEEVQNAEGRLDVLINNAGSSVPWVPIAKSNPKQYWDSMSVNIKGPYSFLHAFLPLLQATAQKYNISSRRGSFWTSSWYTKSFSIKPAASYIYEKPLVPSSHVPSRVLLECVPHINIGSGLIICAMNDDSLRCVYPCLQPLLLDRRPRQPAWHAIRLRRQSPLAQADI